MGDIIKPGEPDGEKKEPLLGKDEQGSPILLRHRIDERGVLIVEMDIAHISLPTARGLLLQMDDFVCFWFRQMSEKQRAKKVDLTAGLRNFVGKLAR